VRISALDRFAAVPQFVVEEASGNAVKLFAILYGLGSFDRPERTVSRRDLAERMGASVDTVDRLLAELVGLEALEVSRQKLPSGNWGTSTYYLATTRGVAAALRPPLAAPVRPGSRTGAHSSSSSSESDTQSTTPSAFEEFWQSYPEDRRQGKGKAREAFEKAVRGDRRARRDPVESGRILAGVRRFAADPNLPTGAEARFVPLPATWLNQQRWEDGPLPDRGRGATVHDIAAHLRRRKEA
jgi:hypothetical protein